MATNWISTDEAAELSGYHTDYIRQLVRRSKIKANRKGTMYWIDRESFLDFLNKEKKAQSQDRRHGPHGTPKT